MAFGDADLEYIMSDVFSVPVIYGGQKTTGILDVADHEVFDDNTGRAVQMRRTVLSIKTGSLTGVAVDTAIKVDGNSLFVRDPSLREDGNITELLLANA